VFGLISFAAVTKERLQTIEEKTRILRDTLTLKRPEVQDFLERFEMSWVYHDNALEGSVYTASDLTAALHPGAVAPEASLLPIVWEIRNHKTAVEIIREEAKASKKHAPLTLTFVKRLHDVVSGVTPEALASRAQAERRERTEKELAKEREKQGYRKEMPLHRTYTHEIAQPAKIQGALEKVLDFTASAEFRELHPILQAVRMQYQFIQVFPFTEHSGKVGRLLSNYLLMRNGYFPAVFIDKDRQKYHEAFKGTLTTFGALMMDAMENALNNGNKFFRDLHRVYR
jgi:Fic family protein